MDEGRNVLIVAHGNVLRCIIAHVAGLTEPEMLQLQVMYKILLYLYNPSSLIDKCESFTLFFLAFFPFPERELINVFIYSQVMTGLPYAYAFDGSVFAEFCVLPPTDPSCNAPREALSRGITSTTKWSEIDSLI